MGRKIGLSEGHNSLKMTGEKDGENIMFLSLLAKQREQGLQGEAVTVFSPITEVPSGAEPFRSQVCSDGCFQ